MATLSFQVHTDKENETPLHRLKGKSLQAFPKRSNTFAKPTPRKALANVNQELPPAAHGMKGNGLGFRKGPVESLFKNSVGDENSQSGHSMKKKKTKRSPVVHTAKKIRTPKGNFKPPADPIDKIPDDIDYDSDTILPYADRLSGYVDRLLTWRPPCLFGSIPDSDSDLDDFSNGNEKFNLDISLDEIPAPFCEVDSQELPEDLSELLVDMPSSSSIITSVPVIQNMSQDDLVNQSLDTSLHFGSLHLNTSDLSIDRDLGLGMQDLLHHSKD